MRRQLIGTLLIAVCCVLTGTTRAATITVLAASSLTDAMTDVARSYAAATGNTLRLSFASSSTLARQIAAGAPADLYISANQQWMSWLSDQHLLADGSRHNFLTNALVLIAPSNSPLEAFTMSTTTDINHLIGDRDRVAVGDPAHVPAGIYAQQAFSSFGWWETLKPRLARADNVRAALALVERGETPLGVVYKTDAIITNRLKILAIFPEDSHQPIIYPVAIIHDRDTPTSLRCLHWLMGDDAGTIFAHYGFDRPATTNTQ